MISPYANYKQNETSNAGSYVAAVFASIVVIGIVIAAYMYHRKRVASLKKEIAQVHYTAEPVTPPGNNRHNKKLKN